MTALQEASSGDSAPQRVPIEGESMSPSLQPGDTVLAQALGGQAPEVGEVVLIQGANGPPAIHRVIARRRRASRWLFVTMGDAMGHTDAVVDEPRVLARVAFVERDGATTPISKHRPGAWSRLEAWVKLVLHGRVGEGHPLRNAARAIAGLGRRR